MIKITISEEIKNVCPQFVCATLEAKFVNTPYSDKLWEEINTFRQAYLKTYTTESIKLMPSIQATRTAYKRCGKDPSRYRPSGEALVRRLLNGHELYQINTVVDLINLASISFGYSIGGFDIDKIKGTELVLGIGKAGEPYEGIGRGALNIEGLPVYRDAIGGIGTPTSDNERTKLDLSSTHLLAIVNGYDGNKENVQSCASFMLERLKRYAQTENGQIALF